MTEKIAYLRKRYRETPSADKKVKFSDIHSDLTTRFPSVSWNSRQVSETVQSAFPQSSSKQHGKYHTTYVHGIEANEPDHADPILLASLKQSLEAEKAKNEQLVLNTLKLEEENAKLRGLLATAFQSDVIESQVQSMMNLGRSAYHGPDTVDHFYSFSIDHVISELHTHAPDVFRLFNLIGNVDRHEDAENSKTAQLRSVSSLLNLLKCRSVKVLGVQLLLTFMLIARATNKQVSTYNTVFIIVVNNL
jgi:hypothetical protein